MRILTEINSPADLKKLKKEQLKELAVEMREALLNRLSKYGGHFGPNFGIVEATIALHYVFNSPVDKFVFDVSHQCYSHKMLTGRKDAYIYDEHFDDVSGYTNPKESEHDFFTVGHTSTSISLATGLAKARDLKGDKENIIAIIGDGSLSGGEALEGLNFATELNSNFIIIVNDNDMSIAENHGGLYKNLKELRESNGTSSTNLFKAMGLDYIYQKDGNDIEKLIETFSKVKDIDHPIVVHINTKKGNGYTIAEENKEAWHFRSPFDVQTGNLKNSPNGKNYATLTADFLLDKMKNDKSIVTVVAAVPAAVGFNKEKRDLAGEQFVDVGIAEEHAVSMISGIAKNGGNPILGIHSTFIQRTYDQLSQDLCINNNPVTILVNTASVYGINEITHLGIFDIPLISNIPNMVYLAPTSKEEYFAMIDWSIHQKAHPVAIRIPCNGVISDNRKVDRDYSDINKYKIEQNGSKICILALGDFYQIGEQVARKIEEELEIIPTVVNPRYITGLDKELLEKIKSNHELIITLEDGMIEGGFGQKIASFYGTSNIKVKNYGIKKCFPDRYKVDELLKENGMSLVQIMNDIKNHIKK